MDIVLGIIGGLIILVVLVVVHELGHAIVASRNGVVVEEFGIGFPPRAWSRKLKNGILFSLNWLPLGGFVKLQGEHDAANKKGDYGAASFWQKTKILFAGVVMNWVIAAVLLSILALTGLPKVLPDQFSIPSDRTDTAQPVELTDIVKNYPADMAGLKAGDQIVRFAGQEVPNTQALITISKQFKGKQVEIVYTRGGEESTAKVNLRNTSSEDFGVELGQREIITTTWSAPIVGVVTTAQFTWVTLQGLGNLVANLASGLALQLSPNHSAHVTASSDLAAVSSSVAGPVGILGTIFPAAERAGPTQLVFLTAIISLTLAVMNVLPIPALDGGSWFLMFLFKVMKRPLTKEREERIKGIGFTVLMLIVIVVTVGDVAKLF
jgi:regulator of sigma E protease